MYIQIKRVNCEHYSDRCIIVLSIVTFYNRIKNILANYYCIKMKMLTFQRNYYCDIFDFIE